MAIDKILMPKETAGWLIDNTTLSFDQIADFCGIHILEVQALADRETGDYSIGFNPILSGMITREDIERCEKDPDARMEANKTLQDFVKKARSVKSRYTPMAHRQNRPDAIMWLVKNYPELSNAQICRLVHTTNPTVESIRNRTHRDIQNIEPRNPVGLDMCSEADLLAAVEAAKSAK
jgi:hypothetical protein